jgi:hypothetical protein
MESEHVKIGKALLNKILCVAFSKQYTDAGTFAYRIAEFLREYFTAKELERIAKETDKIKVYRSYVYENHHDVFKYHIVMEYRDYKITFIVTEEKRDIDWFITDVSPGAVWIPITKT